MGRNVTLKDAKEQVRAESVTAWGSFAALSAPVVLVAVVAVVLVGTVFARADLVPVAVALALAAMVATRLPALLAQRSTYVVVSDRRVYYRAGRDGDARVLSLNDVEGAAVHPGICGASSLVLARRGSTSAIVIPGLANAGELRDAIEKGMAEAAERRQHRSR